MKVYKVCSKCKLEKLAIEFGKHKNRSDGLQSFCKRCNKKNSKVWYKDNNPEHRRTIRERKQKYKNHFYEFLLKYFEEHPCVDCGETNPLVLDFDHRDESTKSFSIAELGNVVSGWDLQKVKTEIEKCDVRCANCHRIKTSIERNHTRYRMWKKMSDNLASVAQRF